MHRRQAAERIRYECSRSPSSGSAAASRGGDKRGGDTAKNPFPHSSRPYGPYVLARRNKMGATCELLRGVGRKARRAAGSMSHVT